MPRHSATGNVRKTCGCPRPRCWACAHPWYIDVKAPKDHPTKPDQRYRKNLDLLIGRHAADLAEAQAEARRAIVAWLDGRDPADLQPGDRKSLADVIAAFQKRPGAAAAAAQIGPITRTIVQGRPFGSWPIEAITRVELDQFREQRPLVAGNRNLAYLRALFNWAVADGLVPRTPFRVGDVSVVRLRRETARTRRLQGDEEERLLLAARGLSALVIGALETGCRVGELLSLQWHQVRFSPRAELFLPAQKTKAKKDRRVPISTTLRAVLDARRHDPAGELVPPDGFVFGDQVGRRRHSIKTAWRLVCRRAKIDDLHFHDLRREAGSRWMDAGVPLATIQRWLGHHNISQTSRYLAASLGGDEDEMRLFEQRIGRLAPAVPLTYTDTNADFTGRGGPRSGSETAEKTQSIAIESDRVPAVH